MDRIASFCVDHNVLPRGVHVSRIDGDITTYDLRMKKPNKEEVLENSAIHTIEHLFATYVRNSAFASAIIYFGPMGCRTGFYFLVRDLEMDKVLELTKEAFLFIKDYEGEIPGCSEVECGNCLDHSLEKAKKEAALYYEVLQSL